MYEYEWDEKKRERALRVHGVDFADAERFDWDSADIREDTRQDYGETRFLSIGPIDERLHVMVWCWRDDVVRIISLRKANRREGKCYGKKILH